MIFKGKNIDLVSVRLEDAQFILCLRLDENRSRFLSSVANYLKAQEAWINEYLKREQNKDEYYFIVTDKAGDQLGAVRVYDFQGDSFSWGSWVIRQGAPTYVAIESAICVYEFAFNILGFKKSHFEVRKMNDKVIAFHQRFGAKICREDELNYYFEFSLHDYLLVRKKYVKYLSSEIQA